MMDVAAPLRDLGLEWLESVFSEAEIDRPSPAELTGNELLTSVLRALTEGFETADVAEATALLESLR